MSDIPTPVNEAEQILMEAQGMTPSIDSVNAWGSRQEALKKLEKFYKAKHYKEAVEILDGYLAATGDSLPTVRKYLAKQFNQDKQ